MEAEPLLSGANERSMDELAARDCRVVVKQRVVFAVLAFFGLVNVYAMRVNLSVAILDMSEQFGWNNATSGLVLSTFFIGYMVGQIPGGYIASKFGGKLVFGIGVTATALLTLLLPLAATGNLGGRGDHALWGNYPIYFLRILMGAFESVTFPALYALMKEWVPNGERSLMVGFIMAGAEGGTILSFPISSHLCSLGKVAVDGDAAALSLGALSNSTSRGDSIIFDTPFGAVTSWASVFYFFGLTGVLWAPLWFTFTANDPASSRCISEAEREYVLATTMSHGTHNDSGVDSVIAEGARESPDGEAESPDGETGGKVAPASVVRDSPNWCALVTNPACIAIFTVHFADSWSDYTILTWLPRFIKERYSVDIDHSAYLEVLPYAAIFVVSIVGGWVCDLLVTLPIAEATAAAATEGADVEGGEGKVGATPGSEGEGRERATRYAAIVDEGAAGNNMLPSGAIAVSTDASTDASTASADVALPQVSCCARYCRCHCVPLRTGRLLFQGLGMLVPAAALVGMTFADSPALGIGLMTLAVGFSGFTYAGVTSNFLDVCPSTPSALFAISNTIATIPGIVSPFLTGMILGSAVDSDTDSSEAERWRIVFILAAAIYLVGYGVWVIFMRAEPLPALAPVQRARSGTSVDSIDDDAPVKSRAASSMVLELGDRSRSSSRVLPRA